jgi:membrane protein
MTARIKRILSALKEAFHEWWDKDPFRESAVIAYYSIFALPGLLVVVITLAGYFFGQEAVSGKIASQITSTMGAETAGQIQHILVMATQSKNSVLANTVGVLTILLGATGVFIEFQKSLNTIWKVKPDITKSGVMDFIKVRLFSFGLILSFAFILLASLLISTLLTALSNWIIERSSAALLTVLQMITNLVSMSILSVLFAFMYKFFPDAKIKWRHVWLGAVVTALLFEVGKAAMGLYFGRTNPGSGYGAAGSIILIMLWVSYSSMIVFYGAEFTKAYANLQDGTIPPAENAVKVVEVKQA